MKKKAVSRKTPRSAAPSRLFLLQAVLILLSWKLWPVLALSLLAAPLLLASARKSRLFLCFWFVSVALLVASRFLPPFWALWAGRAFLLPASLAGAVLLGLLEDAFRKKGRKGSDLPALLYAANAASVAALVLLHAGWACFVLAPSGRIPTLYGLILAAVAIGVALLCLSAWSRKQSWDLVLGAVIFTVIWWALGITGFAFFL